jgi:hypothetical protein
VRRLVLTAFAMMVLLPSIAFGGRSEYLCRLDGKVRSSCCCPSAAHPQEPRGPTSVRGACCCTILETAPTRAQPTTEGQAAGSRSHLAALITGVSSHAAPVLAVSAVVPLRRSLAPPAQPQNLFVRHCAWLL